MDTGRLERIYEEQFIEREWWGDFPKPGQVVKKDFSGISVTDLVAICAKIALHITGEIPRIILSNKAPNISINPSKVALHIKLLRLELPESIRINALFGCFIHELGHLFYTRKDMAAEGEKSYSQAFHAVLHMIEDRRIESKLVADFPGYHYFLYAARRLYLAVGWKVMEERTGYYGGAATKGRDENGEDGTEALMDYICARILFPNLLEDCFWLRTIRSFPGNALKVEEIDRILQPVKQYARLSFKEVTALAEDLLLIVGKREVFYENFLLKEMKNTINSIDNFQTDQQIRMAESVIRDMQRTFNTADIYYALPSVSKDTHQQVAEKEFLHRIREVQAESSGISEILLNKAQELACGIRIQLSMFAAKWDKVRILYEQDTGELDEDDLYQSRFNRNVFWDDWPLPSARLEVIVLLDLSGSMVTGNKLNMQIVMASALALAFERYANTIAYSIYGQRCDDEGIEITCFHRAGNRLQLEKLFNQQALHANADGYAMQYCLRKFRKGPGHKLFFMISDGMPSVVGYEGEDAKEYVRQVVDQAKKENIEVLSIGIDNFDQSDMYDEFIPYSGPETAVVLSKWLKKKLRHLGDEAFF